MATKAVKGRQGAPEEEISVGYTELKRRRFLVWVGGTGNWLCAEVAPGTRAGPW